MAKFITLDNLSYFLGKVKTWVQGLGYQTASQVDSTISSKGYQTSEQVETAIISKGYATSSSVTSTVDAAKTELQNAINAAASSVYEPKGSSAFASLPAPAKELVGDVYNVTDEFTTTESFVEGAGKKYPAGTNVVCVSDGDTYKWDVLSGVVDLSGYLQSSDLEAVTTTEIDQMFSE